MLLVWATAIVSSLAVFYYLRGGFRRRGSQLPTISLYTEEFRMIPSLPQGTVRVSGEYWKKVTAKFGLPSTVEGTIMRLDPSNDWLTLLATRRIPVQIWVDSALGHWEVGVGPEDWKKLRLDKGGMRVQLEFKGPKPVYVELPVPPKRGRRWGLRGPPPTKRSEDPHKVLVASGVSAKRDDEE